jgi:hypothetical protein
MSQPSRRERLRPAEYVMISGILALFGGLVGLMVTRDLVVAVVLSGLIFVLVIIGIAMLILTMTPNTTPEGQQDSPGTGND